MGAPEEKVEPAGEAQKEAVTKEAVTEEPKEAVTEEPKEETAAGATTPSTKAGDSPSNSFEKTQTVEPPASDLVTSLAKLFGIGCCRSPDTMGDVVGNDAPANVA